MFLPLLLALSLHQAPPLTTLSEQSGFVRTGRYAEVEQLCRDFAKIYPDRVRCLSFGTSPEGRPLLALVAGASDALTPAAVVKLGRPVLYFQGGIHAGEIDGKDAGFWLLRDLLAGTVLPGALDAVTLIFVPVFNVDGHERFGKNHRPNQVGPEETGFRVTGQNLNLNRDYVKADAPEMRALLTLLQTWDPILTIDLHVTDGAKFEPDVAVMVEPRKGGPEALRPLGEAMQQRLLAKLAQEGNLPLPFYPEFRVHDDPSTGFEYVVSPPRFSQSYWAEQGRFGILVETHSWRPYAHRVKTTRRVLENLIEQGVDQGKQWREAIRQNDIRAAIRGGTPLTLAWEPTGESKLIDFRGYAYRRELSPLSGQKQVSYDDSKPQVWKVPYRDTMKPALTVRLPKGGYLVPPAHAGWVAQKLALHGIRSRLLNHPLPNVSVEELRGRTPQFAPVSSEGRQRLTIEGDWTQAKKDLPAGTLFVPSAQRASTLLAHVLEPKGPDSLLAWGFFNAQFEQKEYVEDYVLEPFARALLASDASVKQAWEQRLKDPVFAKDPKARLGFFAERHPSRDTQLHVYPVLRSEAVLGVQ